MSLAYTQSGAKAGERRRAAFPRFRQLVQMRREDDSVGESTLLSGDSVQIRAHKAHPSVPFRERGTVSARTRSERQKQKRD